MPTKYRKGMQRMKAFVTLFSAAFKKKWKKT